MKKIKVALKRKPYTVFLSQGDWKSFLKTIKTFLKEKRLFVITDHRIAKLYRRKLSKIFNNHFSSVWITIPSGEKQKTLKTCELLFQKLLKNGANRNSLILALGGGVITDIAGFVASIYMRGINHICVPTTLLAQVDAAIGGKTGINLSSGKNLVGSFHQPKTVLIHTDFLKTLSQGDLSCGLAEVIKYAMISDKRFFDWLCKKHKAILNRESKTLVSMITKCCEIKARFVANDEKDHSERLKLNFGHSLAHAIEAIPAYKKYSHGKAVAMGMVFAAYLSEKRKGTGEGLTSSLKALLKKFGLPGTWPDFPKKSYQSFLVHDKKGQGEYLKFILLRKIGQADIVHLKVKEILEWL